VDRCAKKGAGFPVSDGELRLDKAAEAADGDEVSRPPDRLGIDQHRHLSVDSVIDGVGADFSHAK
jgi:hypothetical protein